MSGRDLKLIAVITMTLDHIGWILVRGGSLYIPLRLIGRFAFPIYVFLLVQGNIHTRSRLRYVLRMAAFALISEVPFDLAGHGCLWTFTSQNIFFTLLLGEMMLWFLTELWKREGIPPEGLEGRTVGAVLGAQPIPMLMSMACVVCFMMIAELLRTDYGSGGILLIALTALVQPWTKRSAVIMTVAAAVMWFGMGSLLIQMAAALAFLVPIAFYDGTAGDGGRSFKYLFYIYYPLHLLILSGIRSLIA